MKYLILAVLLVNLSHAATIRDNEIDIHMFGTQTAPRISFELIEYSISSGQPWDGIEQLTPTTLNFKAGRHKSQMVVDWVRSKQHAPYTQEDAASYANPAVPEELNFAALGNLRIKGQYSSSDLECQNVILAQGSSWTHNYWWIFSNLMQVNKFSPHSTLLQCYYTLAPQMDIYLVFYFNSENNLGYAIWF